MLRFFRSSVGSVLVVAAVGFVGGFVGGGCFPDVSVEPGLRVQLSCASDDDCPDGFNCKKLDDAESFCIASDVLAKEPIALVEPLTLNAARRAPQPPNDTLEATFSFSEAPDVLDVSLDGGALACAASADVEFGFVCSLRITADVTPGPNEVRLRARDAALNDIDERAALFVDVNAPAVANVTAIITAPGNIITAPSAATVGSVVHVTLVFDEDLKLAPTDAVLVPGGEACVVDADASDGAVVVCDIVIADSTEGTRQLHLTVSDTLDNAGAVDADLDVVFDFTPPLAPDLALEGGVVYERAPWGKDGSPAASFAVVIADGVLGAGEALAVFADVEGSRALGTGTGSVDLGALDHDIVFAAAVDGAGLPSPVGAVQQERFTTTFAGKSRRNVGVNPHAAFAVPVFGAPLTDGSEVTSEIKNDDYGALAPDVDGVVNVAARATWRAHAFATAPPERDDACLAYDSARGQAVLFGGVDSGVSLNDTWTFSDGRWTQQAPRTSPPPTRRMGCAYDAFRDVVVVAGGEAGGRATGEIWLWDGNDWTLDGDLDASGGTDNFVGAFDAAAGRVVFVGGGNVHFVDDGGDVIGVFPTADATGALVVSFDGAVDSRVLLQVGGSTFLLEDGVTWAPVALAVNELESSAAPPLLYVDGDGTPTLINRDDDDALGKRFRFVDDSWRLATPLPRAHRTPDAAVFVDGGANHDDVDGADAVLFVGGGAPTALVSGVAVREAQTAATSTRIFDAAFDPGDADEDADDAAGLLVNVDGAVFRLTDAGAVDLGVNAFDGAWIDGVTGGARASVVGFQGVVVEFDADGSGEFVSRITNNDTMADVFDGDAVRLGDTIVYVETDGGTHLLGADNVWVDGAAGPLGALGAGLAVAGAKVVLFPDVNGHTFTFDGSQWSDLGLIGPGVAGATSNVDMASDVDSGTAVVFGGLRQGVALDEAWRFDGAAWTQIVLDGAPPARFSPTLGYDAARHVVVVGGGFGDDTSGLFELDSGVTDAPALRFALSLATVRREAALVGLDVDVGAVDSGASVFAWQAGAWVPLDGVLLGPPGGLARLPTGAAPTVHLVARGNRGGSVAVTQFQTTFTFRSP